MPRSPLDRQKDKTPVKTLPSGRTTYAGGKDTVQSSYEKSYAGRCLLDSRVPILIIITILLAFRNWFCTRGVSLENSLFTNCISSMRISYSSTQNLVEPKKVHACSKYELDLIIIACSKCLHIHFNHDYVCMPILLTDIIIDCITSHKNLEPNF